MPCLMCNDKGQILYFYDRPNSPQGNQYIPCPLCEAEKKIEELEKQLKLTISDGPGDRSIDIHIKSEKLEMLVNVNNKRVGYYADDHKIDNIKGEINSLKDLMNVLNWLRKIEYT